MHRLVSFKSRTFNTTFNVQNAIKARASFCSFCRNTLHTTTTPPEYYIQTRCQSTKVILTQKLLKRKPKLKSSRKYVELLEVKDTQMKETKAPVSKLKAIHISKLASNPEVSLGQLHKLTSKKPNIGNKTSFVLEATQDVAHESASMTAIFNEDYAITFTPEQISHIKKLLQSEETIKAIKDSYDKFRRETAENPLNNSEFNEFELSCHKDDIMDVLETPVNDRYLKTSNLLHLDDFSDVDVDNSLIFDDGQNLKSDSRDQADATNDIEKNIASVPKSNSTLKTKKKPKNKLKELSAAQNELIRRNKQVSLLKLLHAHLDVCISIGSQDKAYKILMYYRNRSKKNTQNPAVNNISLYNMILAGFAKKGDYDAVVNLLNILKDDKIDLDVHSYGTIFEAIERSSIEKKQLKLLEYYNQMISKGITLDDLMNKYKFVNDQWDVITRAINRINPEFEPTFKFSNPDYNCKLVNQLNPSTISDCKNVYNGSGHLTSPAKGILKSDIMIEKISEQIKNECRGSVEIKNIEVKDNVSESVLLYREKLKNLESEWKDTIHHALVRSLASLQSQANTSNSALNIYQYLTSINMDDYVELLLLEIRKIADGSETYSPTIKMLQREIGVKVYYRYQINKMKNNGTMDKTIDIYNKYFDWYMNKNVTFGSNDLNSRRKWQQLIFANRKGVSLEQNNLMWPYGVCIAIGKFLYDILLNDVKINANIFKKKNSQPHYIPILYNIFRGKGKFLRREIKPHPLLPKLVRESMPLTLHMDTILLPSLCPPMPWYNALQGGYLLTSTSVMRSTSSLVQQVECLTETPPENLYPALDSLNQLGAIPWIINKPVLDVLLHVFKTGGSKSLDVARPSTAVPQPPPMSASISKKERSAIMKQRAIVTRMRQEMHSLWCDMLYKLSLANHLRNEIFWLPHNMDFRGRVYPCPPHLSHLGADSSRALLVFAQGSPLGPRGLSWLKLHCINLTGSMKRNTIDERLSYVETIMDDILDSADRPLEGKRWWAKSEEPWQTLACCKEIANAVRHPNPEEYVCHFPVHQDGSCNGLQHYAALGRDSAGAFSVNLSHADQPQDVYSAVVALVEANRATDAANGVKIAQTLEGFVSRKVIKQTVMTTVYGVTKYGARLQIAKQLKDIDEFPKTQIWAASSYLTKKTFESLQEMFTSTKEIQDWFTECAKLISGVCGSKIEWITPLGLPVVQPYHKTTKPHSHNRGILYDYTAFDKLDKPCIMKQKNAFPPNFIHSLDSSHMMLTSLFCEASDVTFVSVHDCFWTHPSSVEVMNLICREQFVALHSQPILETLSEYLVEKFSFGENEFHNTGSVKEASKKRLNCILRQLPEKGNFELQNVLKSVYFFS